MSSPRTLRAGCAREVVRSGDSNLRLGTWQDGTLYPNDGGYVDHIRENARKYIARKLSINEEDAEELRKKALATSNQTAKGLKTLGYDWDFEEFGKQTRALRK